MFFSVLIKHFDLGEFSTGKRSPPPLRRQQIIDTSDCAMLAESAFSSSRNLSSACLNYYTMPLRFLYRTADISALSRRLDSAEIYTRYNNVNGIVHKNVNLVLFYSVSGNGDFYGKSKKLFLLYCPPHILHPY